MEQKKLHNSVLLIDKPVGRTSYNTIEEVQNLLKADKIGHSGTLDKFASGLLIVCTGFATKLTRFFLESDKRYIGIIRLGVTTDTCDIEGKVVERKEIIEIDNKIIHELKNKFRGDITQVPPVYSALKINSRRASDLTREGKKVTLKERRVHISDLVLKVVDNDSSLLRISVACSKGTYIRAIARDIGEYLKTGAYLEELRRTEVGGFSVNDAVTLEELGGILNGSRSEKKFIYNPGEALSDLNYIIISENIRKRVLNGAQFERDELIDMRIIGKKPFKILDEDKKLIALADIDVEKWTVKYLKVFNRE